MRKWDESGERDRSDRMGKLYFYINVEVFMELN